MHKSSQNIAFAIMNHIKKQKFHYGSLFYKAKPPLPLGMLINYIHVDVITYTCHRLIIILISVRKIGPRCSRGSSKGVYVVLLIYIPKDGRRAVCPAAKRHLPSTMAIDASLPHTCVISMLAIC